MIIALVDLGLINCLFTLDDLFDEKIVVILEKDLKYKSRKELCDKTSHKR